MNLDILAGKYRKLCIWLYALIIGVLIHKYVIDEQDTNFRLQIILIALAAPILSLSAELLLKALGLLSNSESKKDTQERYKWGSWLVLAHVLAVGRTTYVTYMTFDDVGYIGVLGLNISSFIRSLFEPINVHLIPFFKIFNGLIYAIWGWDNFGIATFSLLVTSSFYYTFFAILKTWLKSEKPVIPFLAAFFTAIWPVFSFNYVWKAGGVWMFMGGLLFLYFVLAWFKYWETSGKKGLLSIGLLSLATTCTCSFFPMPILLIAPLALIIPKTRWKNTVSLILPAIAVSVGASVLYLIAHKLIFDAFHYHRVMPDMSTMHLFWWVWVSFFTYILIGLKSGSLWISGFVFIVVMIFIPILRFSNLKKKKDPTLFQRAGLYLFSMGLFGYSSLLICAGRACHHHIAAIDRYGIFPTLAVAIYFVALLPSFNRLARPPYRVLSSICVIAVIISAHLIHKKANYPEVIELLASRKKMFKKLEIALCAAYRVNYSHAGSFDQKPFVYLPDIPMPQIRGVNDMGFSHVFLQEKIGFSLRYYAQGLVSSCYDEFFVRFIPKKYLPPEDLNRSFEEPEIRAFYEEYDLSYSNQFSR